MTGQDDGSRVAVTVDGVTAHVDRMEPWQAAGLPRRTRRVMRALLTEALAVLDDAEQPPEQANSPSGEQSDQ